jgi:hypothetical protein
MRSSSISNDVPVKTGPVAGMACTWPVLDNLHEKCICITIKKNFPDLLNIAGRLSLLPVLLT